MADTFIDGIRARGIDSTDISDTNLTLVINEALYEYSRYRPLIEDTTFLTVKDKQTYTWTEIGDQYGISAIDTKWNPAEEFDIWDYAKFLQSYGMERYSGYWHLPSMEILDKIKDAAFSLSHWGTGFQNDTEGGDLYLNPCPETAGLTVYILYTKRHLTTATVKTSDRDLFLDLVESSCASRIGNEISKKSAGMRVKTPEYEIESAAQVKYWSNRADELKQRFIDKCNAGYSAVGRT